MVIGLKKEKKIKMKMHQFRVDKMPAELGRKKKAANWGLCWQFSVDKYAGYFGSENMPAISCRKICRPFRVGKYAGHFGSEDVPAISGLKKNAGNVVSEQNVGKFGPEKNAGKFGPKIKMSVFSGGDKIAGELTGLL